jgi:hypothetical protein
VGQLPSLGDALGADWSIVLNGSTLQSDGSRNDDYSGWNNRALAPFDGVVEPVLVNPIVTEPGTIGKSRSSSVRFLRRDGLQVLYGASGDSRQARR